MKNNAERLGEFIDAKLVNPYELKWLIEQAECVEKLEKERNEYKSALSEIKRFPTFMTKDNCVSRALKIPKKVLRKWGKLT